MGTLFHNKKIYGNVGPIRSHSTTLWSCYNYNRQRQLVGFESLWLGFGIRAYGQGVGSIFKLRVSVFRLALGFSLQFT